MTDFSSFRIPPRSIDSINQTTPETQKKEQTPEGSATFQETLKQQLGQIKADADQIAQSDAPRYEDLSQAMQSAKNAFSDTMQAHQMMRQLIDNIDPTESEPNNEGKE